MNNKLNLIRLGILASLLLTEIARAQTNLTTLYTFDGGNFTGGNQPQAGLVLGPDGNFYGTTYYGGSMAGIIYRVTTTGVLTNLASFSYSNGSPSPRPLVIGNDGAFYGTTVTGGGNPNNYGTIFRFTTNGSITYLASFSLTNGANPKGGLTLGPDGNFYGTTTGGGITNSTYPGGLGTVYRFSTNSGITTLYSFTNPTNGVYPSAPLTWGNDGYLYGSTQQGSPGIFGSLFKITTNGALTTLVVFTNPGPVAAGIEAGLTLGSDGIFYGAGVFTAFKYPANGTASLLAYLPGSEVIGSLVQGPDGSLYGATTQGGANNNGTVFKVTTNGAISTLVNFASTNGNWPSGNLVFGNDGNLYGTTSSGGSGVSGPVGTIYKLAFPTVTPPPLGISAYGGQPAVFFPTATGTNFVLQMTTNLATGNWVTVSNGILISGLVITNPPANAFFRLH